MKKHAAIRFVVALLCLFHAVAWACLNGPATSGAIMRREHIGTWALAWGISAVVAFLAFLVHALTRAMSRDFLALFDVVSLSRHEALRQKHGKLLKAHRELASKHRNLKDKYDRDCYARECIRELDDAPFVQPAQAQ